MRSFLLYENLAFTSSNIVPITASYEDYKRFFKKVRRTTDYYVMKKQNCYIYLRIFGKSKATTTNESNLHSSAELIFSKIHRCSWTMFSILSGLVSDVSKEWGILSTVVGVQFLLHDRTRLMVFQRDFFTWNLAVEEARLNFPRLWAAISPDSGHLLLRLTVIFFSPLETVRMKAARLVS